MRRPLVTRSVGSFELRSGHLRIVDPLEAPGFSALNVFRARPGEWGAYLRVGGYRERDACIWELVVAAAELDPFTLDAWDLSPVMCAVNSRICGAVDDATFPAKGYGGGVFEEIASAARGADEVALLPSGVFVYAGRGNGLYDVWVNRDATTGRAVAVRVSFLEAARDELTGEVIARAWGA